MSEPRTLRILIVDDDPAMATLARQLIRGHGYPDPRVVTSGSELLANTEPADIILLDHQLPDVTGLELVGTLRARPGHPSIILITGNGDETLAASALRRGAEDYLVKDGSLPRLLPEVIERVRRTRALRSALVAAEEDLVQAERLAAIGQLMVTLHHEINNPLMSATAELELLLVKGGGADRAALENIRNSLGRIRDVLKKVGDLSDSRTTNYLKDIGMLDLASGQSASAVSRGDAVLWVDDESVARVTGLLLRHAGFTARRVSGIEEVIRDAGRLGVALLLIAQPAGAGARPLGGFRPEKGHFYTLVALASGDGEPERTAGADAVIRLPFDPGSFTEEVLRALEKSGS
ncbi:MAG: response regulator [Gemmatimonadota bacterium]